MLLVCGRGIAADGPRYGKPEAGLHARRDTTSLMAEPKCLRQPNAPAAVSPQQYTGAIVSAWWQPAAHRVVGAGG
jgi:hypothetical protein